MQRLDPRTTAVIVIDVQERLAPAMPEEHLAQLMRSSRILLRGAALLGAPVLATEQYPRGLGATVPELGEQLRELNVAPREKLSFSACDDEAFMADLESSGARAAVVVGMESHVCVYQTVRDLVERGLDVHVPVDGVCSRRDDHRQAGIELCVRAGAVKTTTESIAFDWLRVAGSPEFKELSGLIR